ncbi:MAG TPA: helix-turn-helix domain-containing protein [Acidimicrobiales bacterium]|jgi:transcriptional regulator with XRE-family HTH domain
MARWKVQSGADLARAIVDARTELGLTQQELAARAGLERTYVARLEGGATVQQVERALRLLRRMGASVWIEMPEQGS